MALLEVKPISTTSTVFETGMFSVQTSNTSSPPKPLLIVTPTNEGKYPVLLFLHGFYLHNCFYTDLLKHIASHGFIAVAPQLYGLIPPSGEEEIHSAAAVTNWLSQGLKSELPENVQANLLKLALVGHSRGGKVAFSLALGQYEKTSLSFSVLIGIDPVAGSKKGSETEPKILTYVPRSFNLGIPVMVVGTGLGEEKANCLFPACAPEGVNHKEFFNECQPPCCYFVTKDYGHMDMLDDNPPGIIGTVSGCICKNGNGARDPMRRSVGGIVVAFLKAYLESQNEDLTAIIDEPGIAPVKLDPVEFIEA